MKSSKHAKIVHTREMWKVLFSNLSPKIQLAILNFISSLLLLLLEGFTHISKSISKVNLA